MPQFKNVIQKARKDHVCDWCCKPIKAGELYFYSAGVYDGDFSTLKYHLECNKSIGDFVKEEGIGEYGLHELQDMYHDRLKNK